jgi:hypothetical protein
MSWWALPHQRTAAAGQTIDRSHAGIHPRGCRHHPAPLGQGGWTGLIRGAFPGVSGASAPEFVSGSCARRIENRDSDPSLGGADPWVEPPSASLASCMVTRRQTASPRLSRRLSWFGVSGLLATLNWSAQQAPRGRAESAGESRLQGFLSLPASPADWLRSDLGTHDVACGQKAFWPARDRRLLARTVHEEAAGKPCLSRFTCGGAILSSDGNRALCRS